MVATIIGEKIISDFVNHTIKQFLIIMCSSGILKDSEFISAEKIFNSSLQIIRFKPMGDEIAACASPVNGTLFINEKYKKCFDEAESFDDAVFDKAQPIGDKQAEPLKKTLFHEFVHFLQKKDFVVGYERADILERKTWVGRALGEVAAIFGQEIIWEKYLKEAKGDKSARYTQLKKQVSDGEYEIPVTLSNTVKSHGPGSSGYFRETDVGLRLLKTIDMRMVDFVRSSTVFGQDLQEQVIQKYESETGRKFNEFAFALDNIMLGMTYSTPEHRNMHLHKFYKNYGIAISGMKNFSGGNKLDEGGEFLRKAISLNGTNDKRLLKINGEVFKKE